MKATLYLKLLNSPRTIFIFLISKRSALFDLLESFLSTKSPEGLRSSQLACRVVLFFQNSGGCSESNPCIIHGAISFGVLIRYMQWQQLPNFETDDGCLYFHAYGIEKILWDLKSLVSLNRSDGKNLNYF